MINPNWIYLTWQGISLDEETGRDPVTYYGLDWDQGLGNWTRLTNDSSGTLEYSFNLTSTSPFESNMAMNFRLQPKNGVGFGAYSANLSLNADSVPLRMNAPEPYEPSLVEYNNIQINWAPISSWNDTGGDDINYY